MSDNFLKVPELREPLIPLSVLSLDLEPPAGVDWASYLSGRGFSVELDDVGRLAVTREVARQLLAERSAAEQKAREKAREAAEASDRWHQQHWTAPRGIRADLIPDAVSPAAAMVQAGKDAEPRAVPTQGEWLFGEVDTMVYQPFPPETES